MYDGFNYHSPPGPGGDTSSRDEHGMGLPVHVTFDLKGMSPSSQKNVLNRVSISRRTLFSVTGR